MHYAQKCERPSMRLIRDGEEGKGDERLPNYRCLHCTCRLHYLGCCWFGWCVVYMDQSPDAWATRLEWRFSGMHWKWVYLKRAGTNAGTAQLAVEAVTASVHANYCCDMLM